MYSVKRVREGRSFSTRSVVTRQLGRAIFASLISFHTASEPTTLEHADSMPSVARPETLPDVSPCLAHRPRCSPSSLSPAPTNPFTDAALSTLHNTESCPLCRPVQAAERAKEVLADPSLPEHYRDFIRHSSNRVGPIDFRYCESIRAFNPARAPPERHIWFRARSAVSRAAVMGEAAMQAEAQAMVAGLPATSETAARQAAAVSAVRENALHQCIIAYASDSPLLFTCLQPHGRSVMQMGMMASLDHSMWWHAPAKADEWILFRVTSPRVVSGRGLCMGHMWRGDGTLVATVAQEGVVRTPLYEQVEPHGEDDSAPSRSSRL